ncbi:MAG: CDP-alcohol phosphatidyltransferase [Chloroflexi bacterium]|nr:CDP-alcohol phosphatidyltransferase [Chloroflexota bacterium]
MATSKKHARINDILLGPLERPALRWLAAHMPAWVNPDVLTGIGVVGALLVFISYNLTRSSDIFLWGVNLGLLINWFGDSLDGTLARYRHIERPRYGFFVDHTVDAFNIVLIVLGLALSPYVRFEYAALALVGYLLLSVLVYVRTYIQGVFQISYGKLGPTEARAIVVLANVYVYFWGNPAMQTALGKVRVYDVVTLTFAAILFIIYIVSSLKEARVLAEEDRPSQG